MTSTLPNTSISFEPGHDRSLSRTVTKGKNISGLMSPVSDKLLGVKNPLKTKLGQNWHLGGTLGSSEARIYSFALAGTQL